MPHSENNKKKTQSSISYETLVNLVNEYDQKQMAGLAKNDFASS